MAAAITCLAWWRRRGDEPGDLSSEGEREMRESLSVIRPRLAAMDAAGTLPDDLLAKVDGVIGQDLEDQWTMPLHFPCRGAYNRHG